MHDLFVLNHRNAFCWIDDWIGVSAEEMRR
jgi:hypothetical protein